MVARDNSFKSYTHPARARKLLKEGKAEVFSNDPFTIRLKGEKGKIMTAMKTTTMTNFTEFFRGEERDIYVMNLSNTQVQFDVEVSPGRTVPILIPRTRNPYNLTQHVPFQALKNCVDIRKLVNRRPPVLRLLTYEEYMEYYEIQAKRFNSTPEEEIEKALEVQAGLLTKTAYTAPEDERAKTVEALRAELEKDPEAMAEAQPLPKIIGLCNAVGPDIEKDKKMSANDLLIELELLEPEMKAIDFDYVASHGFYTLVKRWATQKIAGAPAEEEVEEEAKTPSKAPVKAPAKAAAKK